MPHESKEPSLVEPEFVPTLSELPGYVTVAAHGIVADVGTASGMTARTKGVDSFREALEALEGIRLSASFKGGNAVVGVVCPFTSGVQSSGVV